MNAATKSFQVVFTGSADWWQIVSQREEVEIDDGCTGDWEPAAAEAGTNLDCEESWVARVTHVDDRHTAIKVGDYVCCDGIGSEVVFVREVSPAIQAAVEQGVKVFAAKTHVGGAVEFLGYSWEEAGYNVDELGNPRTDSKGNTVATFSAVEFDPASTAHQKLAQEWYE